MHAQSESESLHFLLYADLGGALLRSPKHGSERYTLEVTEVLYIRLLLWVRTDAEHKSLLGASQQVRNVSNIWRVRGSFHACRWDV
jgi:hypothetical protein